MHTADAIVWFGAAWLALVWTLEIVIEHWVSARSPQGIIPNRIAIVIVSGMVISLLAGWSILALFARG